MKRRRFLQLGAAFAALPPSLPDYGQQEGLDLRSSIVVLGSSAGQREQKAAQVLVEEAEKRCGIRWPIATKHEPTDQVAIYIVLRRTPANNKQDAAYAQAENTGEEGYVLQSGQDVSGHWVRVTDGGERGLLFGIGKLLRSIDFGRQIVSHPDVSLHLVSHRNIIFEGISSAIVPRQILWMDAGDV